MGHPPDKTCEACGRRFAWRRKWAASWDTVRYCSAGCRRRGVRGIDRELEEAILATLGERAPGKTICPSEAARRVGREEEQWRALMEPTRRAARRLAHRGELEIVQGGRRVDPEDVRGPIRLRQRRPAGA